MASRVAVLGLQEPVPFVERRGRVHRGHGEAIPPGPGDERVGEPVGHRGAEAVPRHGAGPGQAPEPLHDPRQRNLLRRVGGPDAVERLRVGLAVGAARPSTHTACTVTSSPGVPAAVLQTIRAAPSSASNSRNPVRSSTSGAPASGSDRSARNRPSTSAAATGPGAAQVVERGVGERDRGHGQAPPGAPEGVDDVVERMAATVVAGRSADDQRQVAQVVAEAQELVETLDVDHRGDRPPVAFDHDLATVGGVGDETGDAPPAGLGDAQALGVGHPITVADHCTEFCTDPCETLTSARGCRILPPARRPLRVCSLVLLHGNI